MQLFGFQFKRAEKPRGDSFVPPNTDEAAIDISAPDAYHSNMLSGTEGHDTMGYSENQLIDKYREISYVPEVDNAVQEIGSEAIVNDGTNAPVSLDLSELEISEDIKKKLKNEFDYVLGLLNFKTKGHDIFTRWYIDGRINYHVVVDEKAPKRGIIDIRYIDPKKIKKIRSISKKDQRGLIKSADIKEYYIYNEKGVDMAKGSDVQGIPVAKDSIAHANSGIHSSDNAIIVSYLHKALRPTNNLRMMEDSVVIYTLSRAPERRVFYIDVGNLPKNKAQEYMQKIVRQYKNKIVYNSATGEIKDDRKMMAMTEDYWLPRREGSRGTEIDTLQGGQAIGEVDHVQYFKDNLLEALNVPKSRFDSDAQVVGGRGMEITRDELRFSRFINRVRGRFSMLFDDLLGKQVVLRGILSAEDWEKIKNRVNYDYLEDNYFAEFSSAEIWQTRMNLLRDIEPYMDKFFSKEWVQKNVLKMSDEDITEMDEQIEENPYSDPGEEEDGGGGFGRGKF